MRNVCRVRVRLAAASVVLVALFVALGGVALAQTPSSATDQYATKVKGVTVSDAEPTTQVDAEQSTLPNTGLSLLGVVIVGGTLVGVGIALRKREQGSD